VDPVLAYALGLVLLVALALFLYRLGDDDEKPRRGPR
jgi:hypothetical protein